MYTRMVYTAGRRNLAASHFAYFSIKLNDLLKKPLAERTADELHAIPRPDGNTNPFGERHAQIRQEFDDKRDADFDKKLEVLREESRYNKRNLVIGGLTAATIFAIGLWSDLPVSIISSLLPSAGNDGANN